ncbi:MAG: hypothetical protein JWM90_2166 [Thermoleophilia bacterium]|nr:hypothetical protein [Thermoleophilia bacterium]
MGMPRFRMQRPSYAVCASLLAVVCATTATATAARVKPTITGAHVKNSSLTTNDFKNRSLDYMDFGTKIGAPGTVGSQGQVGDTGRQGSRGTTGASGEVGNAAERQFSFSYRDAGSRFSTITNPNTTAPWYLRNSISGFKSPEFLNTSGLIMTDLAQSQESGGVLNLPRASVVIVTSTISLLHRGDARCDDGFATATMDSAAAACDSPVKITPDESDDVNVHTRVECWTEYANADGSSPARMGEGVFASGWTTERLVNLPLTSGISLSKGSYTFRTVCRMADRTTKQQHDDWEFVHANMSVLAAAQTGI